MGNKSLYDELRYIPRISECSRIVVQKWGLHEDVYLAEIPEITVGNETRCKNYFSITAERFLYRSKILSLPIDTVLAGSQMIQEALPFGNLGPDFITLCDTSVKMAMAFVPFTPTGGNDKAVLARLYCVDGLTTITQPPFSEGTDSHGIGKFSWFVAGVPRVFEGETISGRSWLLAAHLLMKVITDRDGDSARNLVNRFIVTGDVVEGKVSPIDIGKKLDLATIPEYQSYRWILPRQNRKEYKTMKAEYPETLEDARELIRTMRNNATGALIQAAYAGNNTKDAIASLMKCDADPSETSPDIGQNARQVFADAVCTEVHSCKKKIYDKLNECGLKNDCIGKLLDELIVSFLGLMDRERIMSYYGDVPQLFFMLAKAGRRDIVSSLAGIYDIDATDSTGATALDFAKEFDPQVASLLEAAGAKRRGVFEVKCDKMRAAIWTLFSDDDHEKVGAVQYIKEALNYGCSPNAIMEICVNEVDFIEDEWTEYVPQYVDENEADEDDEYSQLFDPHAKHDYKVWAYMRRRYDTTIFWQAVCSGNRELIECCMAHGGDVDVPIRAVTVKKMIKESFARSGKETIEYERVFSDEDFANGGKMTLREFVDSRWARQNLSHEVLKMLKDYSTAQNKGAWLP